MRDRVRSTGTKDAGVVAKFLNRVHTKGMSVLEIKRAISELNQEEVQELKAWFDETQVPWYQQEPHRSRIQQSLANPREPQETDLDEFEAMVFNHYETLERQR